MEANTSAATSKLNSLKVLLKTEPKVISFIQRVLNTANYH
jgi:asparagine N-glycosylation enzyme membrane subunit Stt3